jgi:predicted transcriptional regulator
MHYCLDEDNDMSKETISFRTDDQKVAALDALAIALDRDRSYVLNDAIDGYLEIHRWQIDEIKKAMADADAGLFASEEEVEIFFAKWTDEN